LSIQYPVYYSRRTRDNNNNNNAIQLFIIYLPSQQLQSQLQTQHSVDTGNYIKEKRNIKTTAIYNNNSIQFFIYLRAELNSQWSITASARIQTTTIRQHSKKQTKNNKTTKN
jgi:hypothetical protein